MICDTGPLLAALDRCDAHHGLALRILRRAAGRAVVPDPVIVEVDALARRRLGAHAARAFLDALKAGAHQRLPLTDAVWRRAIAIDAAHPDLDLGIADAVVMAIAEQRDEPILTFDFRDFRAVKGPDNGAWSFVVTEADLR